MFTSSLRLHVPAIFVSTLITFMVGAEFGSGSITSVAGLFLAAPIQVAILKGERFDSDLFFLRYIQVDSFYFAAFNLTLWGASLAFGMYVGTPFLGYWLSKLTLYFPAILMYVLTVSVVTPQLMQAATRQKGERLNWLGGVQVFSIWLAYALILEVSDWLENSHFILKLMCSIVVYSSFILAFCLTAVVIKNCNEAVRPKVSSHRPKK